MITAISDSCPNASEEHSSHIAVILSSGFIQRVMCDKEEEVLKGRVISSFLPWFRHIYFRVWGMGEEVHVHIPEPDREGRKDILNILFRPLIVERLVPAESAELWIRNLGEQIVDIYVLCVCIVNIYMHSMCIAYI